jgi:protein-S-isoprenylcysteine O-methyltransferase Ste14
MTHLLPLIGLAGFVGTGVVWRSWIHSRRYGGSGFALFRSGDWRQDLREALILPIGGIMAWQAVVSAVAPDVIDRARVVQARPSLAYAGALLMLAATALMVAAQLQMGASWRIGIDAAARPGLVVGGLYRFCRNPIFLAMLLVVVGFVLLVPTWTSIAVLVAADALILWSVREEERYLRRTYGDDYAAYAARVGRFVPGVGRLPRAGTAAPRTAA